MKAKKLWLSAIIIGAVAILGTVMVAQFGARAVPGDGQHLEGTWVVSATVTGDPTVIRALITFSRNGEVIETPSTSVGISTGHGAWARTGNREFAITVVYLRRDEADLFNGTSKVRSVFKIDETLDAGAARFETEVFDVDGNLLETFNGTAKAKRIQVEPLE